MVKQLRIVGVATVVLLALATLHNPAHADSWDLPSVMIFLSPDSSTAARIVPRGVESQLAYFQDLSEGLPDPGLPLHATITTPRAEVYRKSSSGGLSPRSSFNLVNSVSPVSALLSNDGQFLVTFDNWHSVGRGEHVVVIYRTDGSLVRSLRLSDFLIEEDINSLAHSVSSTDWSGPHYIEDESGVLVLQIKDCLDDRQECQNKFAPLKIDLASGALLAPKKDLIDHWAYQVELVSSQDVEPTQSNGSIVGSQCDPGWGEDLFGNAQRWPFAALKGPVTRHRLPAYNEISRRAKLEGQMRLEILVAQTGDVVCVRAVRGLPLGLTMDAISVVLDWELTGTKSTDTLRKAEVVLQYERKRVSPRP